jgi:transcriptional regulator with XRE-family HTH domain
MSTSPLHQRLRVAVGRRSFRELAAMTESHPETVRRYVLGQSPSAEFLQRVAEGLEINSEWLLQGRGPMRRNEIRQHALKEANAHELLSAVADSLEKLIERVDRIEVFLHTLESRLRTVPHPHVEVKPPPHPGEGAEAGVNSPHGAPPQAPSLERATTDQPPVQLPRVDDIAGTIKRHKPSRPAPDDNAGPARPGPDRPDAPRGP